MKKSGLHRIIPTHFGWHKLLKKSGLQNIHTFFGGLAQLLKKRFFCTIGTSIEGAATRPLAGKKQQSGAGIIERKGLGRLGERFRIYLLVGLVYTWFGVTRLKYGAGKRKH